MLSHCRRYFVPNSLRLSCKDKNLVEIIVHTRYTFNHYNMAIGSTITVEQPGFQLQYDRFSRRHTSRYPNRIVTIRSYHYAYSAVWIFCLPIPICGDDDCKLWNFRWFLVDLNYEMEKVTACHVVGVDVPIPSEYSLSLFTVAETSESIRKMCAINVRKYLLIQAQTYARFVEPFQEVCSS